MTATDLPAGREMDALIAEKVMGWKRDGIGFYKGNLGRLWRYEPDGDYYACPNNCDLFAPSTDIAAAWRVVEKLIADGKVTTLTVDCCGYPGESWRCVMQWDIEADDNAGHCFEEADTAPLAICRAALKAVAA